MNEVSEAEALIKLTYIINGGCLCFLSARWLRRDFCSCFSYMEDRAENTKIKGQVTVCHLPGQTPTSTNKRAAGYAVYLYCCTLREPH